MVRLSIALLTVAAATGHTQTKRIYQAVTENNVDLVKELISKGQDINERMNGSKQTPLMQAVLGGHFLVAKALLELGADVTVEEKDGYTPLHGAGFQGRAEIARLLLQHGIPIHGTIHNDGYQPFHRACWGQEQRHADTVKVFLENGADPNLKAGNGATCRKITKNPAIIEVLDNFKPSHAPPADAKEELR